MEEIVGTFQNNYQKTEIRCRLMTKQVEKTIMLIYYEGATEDRGASFHQNRTS